MADKLVSPSCFRSHLPYIPFSCTVHSFTIVNSPSVVFESCNVYRASTYFLLDNVDGVIYTSLVSDPGIRLWSRRVIPAGLPSMMRSILQCATDSRRS